MKRYRMFVYGTLKSGYGNNLILRNANADFLGQFLTVKKFVIFNGGIPFVSTPQKGMDDYAGHVVGEVWECDLVTRNRLDQLEGHPYLYKRTNIAVRQHDDTPVENAVVQYATIYLDASPQYSKYRVFDGEQYCVPNKHGHVEWIGPQYMRRSNKIEMM